MTITHYRLIGAEQTLVRVIDRRYFVMDTLLEAQGIRARC
jgi:hypothetical protein